MNRRKEFSTKGVIARSVLIMVILVVSLNFVGCSRRMARMERNQKKLAAMMEKNTVELARQSAEIRQNQRQMQSGLKKSQFSNKNLMARITSLESSQARMIANTEADNHKLVQKVTSSRDSIIEDVTASREDVKEHITVKSESIENRVSAMGEKYEEEVAFAQEEARAASKNVASMKAVFGEMETRLNESFSQKLVAIEANQQTLSDGIKGLQFNVNELSTEMATVKENQGNLKTEFVSENEAFRGEVLQALERLNRMISQLNMKNEPTVAAETTREIKSYSQ